MQTCDNSGVVANEDSQFKIVVKKVSNPDIFWGSDIRIYIENNSNKNIYLRAENVSNNGFTVDLSFSADVL